MYEIIKIVVDVAFVAIVGFAIYSAITKPDRENIPVLSLLPFCNSPGFPPIFPDT